MQEHMHPIQFLLASTQLELLIFPLEQRLRQMNWAINMHLTQSIDKEYSLQTIHTHSGKLIISSNFVSTLRNKITTSIQHSLQQAIIVKNITSNQSFGENIFCMHYGFTSWNRDSWFKTYSVLQNKITPPTRENHTVDNWVDTKLLIKAFSVNNAKLN